MSDKERALEVLQAEMRAGFNMLSEGIAQTNARLDQTNARLDQTNAELRDFRLEVNIKLNGISSLLLSSERNTGRLEERIVRLEDRVDKLEGKDKLAGS
jgi:hypothetical protein